MKDRICSTVQSVPRDPDGMRRVVTRTGPACFVALHGVHTSCSSQSRTLSRNACSLSGRVAAPTTAGLGKDPDGVLAGRARHHLHPGKADATWAASRRSRKPASITRTSGARAGMAAHHTLDRTLIDDDVRRREDGPNSPPCHLAETAEKNLEHMWPPTFRRPTLVGPRSRDERPTGNLRGSPRREVRATRVVPSPRRPGPGCDSATWRACRARCSSPCVPSSTARRRSPWSCCLERGVAAR